MNTISTFGKKYTHLPYRWSSDYEAALWTWARWRKIEKGKLSPKEQRTWQRIKENFTAELYRVAAFFDIPRRHYSGMRIRDIPSSLWKQLSKNMDVENDPSLRGSNISHITCEMEFSSTSDLPGDGVVTPTPFTHPSYLLFRVFFRVHVFSSKGYVGQLHPIADDDSLEIINKNTLKETILPAVAAVTDRFVKDCEATLGTFAGLFWYDVDSKKLGKLHTFIANYMGKNMKALERFKYFFNPRENADLEKIITKHIDKENHIHADIINDIITEDFSILDTAVQTRYGLATSLDEYETPEGDISDEGYRELFRAVKESGIQYHFHLLLNKQLI